MLSSQEYFVIALIGAMVGSFISMLSYRLPLGIDVIMKRSHCPKCKHNLGLLDLVPIFSWLINMGKCRYCHKPISARYLLIELCSIIITCYTYHRFAISDLGLIYWVINLSLFVMVVTDFEYYIIPDTMQLILLIAAVIFGIMHNQSFNTIFSTSCIALASALLLKYSYIIIRQKDGLGWGDVKLIAISGMLINLSMLPIFFFMAGILGVLTAILWRILGKGKIFPFGPALALSLVICLLAPEVSNNFYIMIQQYCGNLEVLK